MENGNRVALSLWNMHKLTRCIMIGFLTDWSSGMDDVDAVSSACYLGYVSDIHI